MTQKGFTFIEVLVAMLIFVLAALAAANIATGSVRATRDAKEMSRATWLLQNVMTELETKLETEGIDKACEKKKEGKFEAPDQNFTWQTECYEIDMRLSQTAAKVAAEAAKTDGSNDDANEPTQENLLQKMILDTASDYISKSLRELHVEVHWMRGKQPQKVTLTTHFARYDLPLNIPGVNSGSTTGGTSSPPPASPSPPQSPAVPH